MPLAETTIDEAEIEAALAVLRSGWLSAGPVTKQFEEAFAARLGVAGAVAVSSGSAALHLALLGLGLQSDDEVIMPSLTYVAGAAMVCWHGGVPIFCDVNSLSDLTLSIEDVERRISTRTKAVIAMHYGGYPADLAELSRLADRSGVALLEDAAHAPFVKTSQGALGTVGDAGCFSFYATKNLTTGGEGGMLVSRRPELLDLVRSMRSHRLSTSTWDRDHGGASDLDVDGLGFNYRPTELGAAIGLAQLDRVEEDRAIRSQLVEAYRQGLEALEGVIVPFSEWTGDTAFHLMAVLLPAGADRFGVRQQLEARRIQTSVHYRPTHQFTYYRHLPTNPDSLPVTDAVADRLLSLPLHSRMTIDDVGLVVESLAEALGRP